MYSSERRALRRNTAPDLPSTATSAVSHLRTQVVDDLVQGAREGPDLIVRARVCARREIAARDARRGLAQIAQRPREHLRHGEGDDQTDHDRDPESEKTVSRGYTYDEQRDARRHGQHDREGGKQASS